MGLAILKGRNKRGAPQNARGRYGTRKSDGPQGPCAEDMGLAILKGAANGGHRGARAADMELANLMDPRGPARNIRHPRFWAPARDRYGTRDSGGARGSLGVARAAAPRVLLDSAGADVARKCVHGFAAI